MKKLQRAVLFALLIFIIKIPAYAESIQVEPTNSTIYINDNNVIIRGYNINGNNYFKLRDLAAALQDTSSCFDVAWNDLANQVELTTQKPYSYDGEGADFYWDLYYPVAVPSDAQLMVNGNPLNVAAYNINDSNYYKLRDLGAVIPFDVYWLEAENAVCIYTELTDGIKLADSSGGEPRMMSSYQSTARWGEIRKSYLYSDNEKTFRTVEVSADDKKEVHVDTYDVNTLELVNTTIVPIELEFFGGFCSGEDYNYMAFGQDNAEENNRKEVIRIVKYDKNFKRKDALSINGKDAYTIRPFDMTSSMSENGSELILHSGRTRYTTDDGLNHQSQLTIIADVDTMQLKNSLGQFQSNHVSHSFNQFVKHDGRKAVLLDHGDAYPRSIVLNEYNGSQFTEVELFKIPGTIGANCTGVTLGGLEVSKNNYLAAINTIDHKKVQSFDSFNMVGLEDDERNIVLLISDKDNTRTANVDQVTLTDYINRGKLGSTPYLVKITNNRFMVLWEEYEYQKDGEYFPPHDCGVRYVEVDENGKMLTKIKAMENMRLSGDCQPIYMNNTIMWYNNAKAGRIFYEIKIN